MELAGKVALVAGGGSGIGLGIALALAREGSRVAICGRGAKRLEEAAGQFDGRPPLLTRTCDVSDRGDVARLIEWLEGEVARPTCSSTAPASTWPSGGSPNSIPTTGTASWPSTPPARSTSSTRYYRA